VAQDLVHHPQEADQIRHPNNKGRSGARPPSAPGPASSATPSGREAAGEPIAAMTAHLDACRNMRQRHPGGQ
jgi:hypothetical protein